MKRKWWFGLLGGIALFVAGVAGFAHQDVVVFGLFGRVGVIGGLVLAGFSANKLRLLDWMGS